MGYAKVFCVVFSFRFQLEISESVNDIYHHEFRNIFLLLFLQFELVAFLIHSMQLSGLHF